MFFTNGYNIRIPRGDSAFIRFTLTQAESGEPYILAAGQTVVFEVCASKGAEPVISKTADKSAQDTQGAVTFSLSPEDTDIARHTYFYSLRIADTDGTVCDTWLGFPDDALFAVGLDCGRSADYTPEGGIRVSVGQGSETMPAYDGEYTVVPSLREPVVLATAQKALRNNITVERVPVSETLNGSGGITIAIGGQNV